MQHRAEVGGVTTDVSPSKFRKKPVVIEAIAAAAAGGGC